MNSRLRKTLPILLLLGLGGLSASSAAAAPARDAKGFLYGRITTRSGSVYEGRLRWNNKEEAFWGDFFNSEKEERPFLEHLPRQGRRRDSIEISAFRSASAATRRTTTGSSSPASATSGASRPAGATTPWSSSRAAPATR